MEEPLAYVRETAPHDVADTIDSLLAAGFLLDRAIGGRDESFGTVQLELVRGAMRVVLTRDRSQWFAEVQPAWADEPVAMHVLLTARDGTPPAEPAEFLPTQLPEGVSWSVELPALIGWAEEDRRSETATAEQEWRSFMKGGLGG